MSAVVASGLQKRFGRIAAVDGMDLVVPAGTCFGLIGQNGAGKTTFIKLLLGICKKDGGDVVVLGGSPDDVKVRRRIGYLPERLLLPPAFTAIAFLQSVARLKGLDARAARDQIPRALQAVGLEEEAWTRRTGGFSKGMKQRTGLASALLGEPDLLVLDEPTDGIDPLGRARIRDVIKAQKERGATVFLNSHLLAETERICDHAAVVARGKVVVSGPLSTLQAKDAHRVRFKLVRRDPASPSSASSSSSARSDAAHETASPPFLSAPTSRADVLADAAACGFVVDAEAAPVDDVVACRFVGGDPAALSAALHAALGRGLVVVEVAPALRDLESILADAVAGGGKAGAA